MLKNILSKIITSHPDTIQFAKDRKYEEAWIIPKNQVRPSEQDIQTYLSKDKFETIIVEYIWNSFDDDNRFVLTLFLDKKCKLQDPKEFIEINLNLFYHYDNFEKLINLIDSQIIGKKYFLNYPIESINLSIFNYWLSVGPVELWKEGEKYDLELVTKKIKLRPEIEKTKLNYQGLLFRFNVNGEFDGPYYGIKMPCCDEKEGIWAINYQKVDYWMRLMLEIR